MIYDVAIIGGGIIGSSIARELSRYKLHTCIIEKEDDVSTGTSKANSGIVHGGYDPEPGSLMAKLNVEGSSLFKTWAKELHIDYKNIGSLVVAFSEEDKDHIKRLYERGKTNGVPQLELISQEKLQEIEPNINPDAVGALLCQSASIISPYQATWAIAENAVDNGVKLFLETKVHSITPPATKTTETTENLWTINTGKGEIKSHFVVNAAGLYSDEISRMAGAKNFIIKPRKGEYFLLDSNVSNLVKHTIFQTPNALGKGVLVTPTVDGNILVGPTAEDTEEKSDTATTRTGQDLILEKAELSIPDIPKRNIINSFSGVRAIAYEVNSDGTTGEKIKDFIIEEDEKQKGFINVAGICSPGLSAAPAIGVYVTELLEKAGLKLTKNPDFIPIHKGIESFKDATLERQQELIEENPLYGRIICRCEMITEGEIVKAIHSTIGARDLDGIKRRVRAGMGRCQSGFCSPKITSILSRELEIPLTSVTKNGGSSYILNSKTR